jgi:RNA polymerase sigma-70 factor (ECF subfamily)
VGAVWGELDTEWTDPQETSSIRDARSMLNAAMDRYANGDEPAFAEVYDLLAPRLYAFLVRQIKSVSQAEDLLQQTLLRLHCARESYVSGADVLPWAFAIGRRLLIDAYRRQRREVLGRDELEGLHQLVSGVARPDEVIEAKQAAEDVERVLASVPEAQRTAFELLKRDGLSLNEAAQVLGTTANAVKLRAHRTYDALRSALRFGDGHSHRKKS